MSNRPSNQSEFLSIAQVRRLHDDLCALWVAMVGRPVSDLDSDLRQLEYWFHPKRESSKLRERFRAAPKARLSGLVAEPLIQRVGRGTLVSPEGRLAIERLRRALEANASIPALPDEGEVGPLLALYRGWSRHRLDDTVAKSEGRGEPLSLLAAGATLLTIALGALSEERAIVVPRAVNDPFGTALRVAIQTFADALVGDEEDRETATFDGYPTQKAEARLEGALARDRRPKRGGRMHIWVYADRRGEALDSICRDLIVQREDLCEPAVVAALRSMLAEFRSRQGAFHHADLVLIGDADQELLVNDVAGSLAAARGAN